MTDQPDPANAFRENITRRLQYMEQKMADLDRDSGLAAAYVYTGHDPQKRAAMDQLAVHAMVRHGAGAGAEMIAIDLYVPYYCFEDMPDLKDTLMYSSEMQCVGTIDNHFTDVFGLVNPIQSNGNTPQKARRNIQGHRYLSQSAADTCRDAWMDNVVDLTTAKQAQLKIYQRFQKALIARRNAETRIGGTFSVN